MALYRTIQLSFWTDSKVVDDFTPEDRYFYLYLMTNPHTTLSGCYEVSIRQIASETGYSKDSVERLLERMERIHDVIRFSKETKEILLLNWSKYNWTSSPKLRPAIVESIKAVKNADFVEFLNNTLYGIDTVSIPYGYGSDTSVTVTVSNTDTVTIKNIIDYLNIKTNKNFKATSDKTKRLMGARLKEGFTEDDFKRVIDTKCAEWLDDPKMNTYLRPETLFGSKFESYLNQKAVKPKGFTGIEAHDEWDASFFESLVDN